MPTTSTSGIFTGSSQFSSDFQQVISRAVSFASLPLQQAQNEVNSLQAQSTELGTLNSRFTAMESVLRSLDSAAGTGSYSATVSDKTIASAALTGTPYAGTYTIEVDSTGAYATSLSSDGLPAVTDPDAGSMSDAANYTLTAGGFSATITPKTKTLTALANAINLSGANVQATVVNIGSASSPDYRLSLQGTKLGDLPIQLIAKDGSHPNQTLLTNGPAGSPAVYKVNGKPPQGIQSDTAAVTISPGLSVSLLNNGTATVTVGRNMTGVSDALSNLVAAYNATTAEIGKNRGTGTGGLNGQSILRTLSDALEQIVHYNSGGSGISSLASIGITADKNGVLSFNSSVFTSATTAHSDQLTAFLGSAGGGRSLEGRLGCHKFADRLEGWHSHDADAVRAIADHPAEREDQWTTRPNQQAANGSDRQDGGGGCGHRHDGAAISISQQHVYGDAAERQERMSYEVEAQTLWDAAGRNDFTAAQTAVQRLVQAVETSLPGLDPEARTSRMREALELIESSRRLLRAEQARLANEMSLVQAQARYVSAEGAPGSTWRLSG
jgi:flagellar hook-associated protein 2